MAAFTVMLAYLLLNINSGAVPLFIISLFMGVQAQLLEIRISLGGSALF